MIVKLLCPSQRTMHLPCSEVFTREKIGLLFFELTIVDCWSLIEKPLQQKCTSSSMSTFTSSNFGSLSACPFKLHSSAVSKDRKQSFERVPIFPSALIPPIIPILVSEIGAKAGNSLGMTIAGVNLSIHSLVGLRFSLVSIMSIHSIELSLFWLLSIPPKK